MALLSVAFLTTLLLNTFFIEEIKSDLPCVEKSFGHSSYVCVCNSTYCDTIESIEPTPKGWYQLYSSSATGSRFQRHMGEFFQEAESQNIITIKREQKYQKILGFGGAFTDAAGINIDQLSSEAQRKLIESYYGVKGIEYNIGRVNMGGCDFSDRPYSYDDVEGDTNLEKFNLTIDDTKYKIPYIKQAEKMMNKSMKLFASPWSAPAWMKTNKQFNGKGVLIKEYYPAWANYFVKFFQAYKDYDVHFWGLTAQNEPENGLIPNFTFNCMGWTAETQAEFVGTNLGPAMEKAGFGDIKIMVFEDQRPLLPKWARQVMQNKAAAKYVSGFAVHWYMDFLGFTEALEECNEEFPDKFIFYTEACNGDKPWDLEKVILGSWNRGQEYFNNIIENINHWSVGWTDWNLALSMDGGPNWANNFVDAPIIVDPTKDEFYKNPTFYALGHFSKFVPENSQRIGFAVHGPDEEDLKIVALERPDGATVVIFTNPKYSTDVHVKIDDKKYGSTQNFILPPQSFHTVIYW